MPDVPIDVPSETAMVLNSIGVPPASRMPRLTSWASSRNMVSVRSMRSVYVAYAW